MAVWSIVKSSALEGPRRLDAEYYSPHYMSMAALLRSHPCATQLGEVASYVTDGTHVTPSYVDSGVPFLSSQNVNELDIDFTNVSYIAEQEHRRLKHCQPQPGDLLISKSGRIGSCAVVPWHVEKGHFNIYEGIAIVRLKPGTNPYFLAVFLNSRFGQFQIQRATKGISQPHLHIEDIKQLYVLPPPSELSAGIDGLAQSIHERLRLSEALYLQAEEAMLEGIHWPKLDLFQPHWWTSPLSRPRDAKRLDAEHFQPKYDKLVAHLKNTGQAQALGAIAAHIKRGLQPDYVESGEIVVVNSQHLGRYLLNVEATERTDTLFWNQNERARLQGNDVLLYSTGAYIGRTNVWLEDRKGLASNHVTIIRPGAGCNPLYLSVFLNSPPGLLQAEKWASGSGQREIYPHDIARFLIWLPSENRQRQVADLVLQSYQARQKAKALLEEAKAKIEALVEEKAD